MKRFSDGGPIHHPIHRSHVPNQCGGFLKWGIPKTMGFSTKIANLDDLGGVHFWKRSYLFLILLVPLWGIYGVCIYICYTRFV